MDRHIIEMMFAGRSQVYDVIKLYDVTKMVKKRRQ